MIYSFPQNDRNEKDITLWNYAFEGWRSPLPPRPRRTHSQSKAARSYHWIIACGVRLCYISVDIREGREGHPLDDSRVAAADDPAAKRLAELSALPAATIQDGRGCDKTCDASAQTAFSSCATVNSEYKTKSVATHLEEHLASLLPADPLSPRRLEELISYGKNVDVLLH